MIWRNTNIRGIHIQKECCLFHYADATIMFLDGTERSLKAVLVLVLQFSNNSELKPNFWITKTIWIRSEPQSSEILSPNLKKKWTKYASNILGIKFGSCLTNINEINFEPKLAFVKEMNNWNKRQLIS